MISNNRVTQHCIRYGKRCSCRAGSKTCPYDPVTPSQTLYKDSTDYLLGGSLVMKNGKTDRLLFEGGFALATSSSSTASTFSFRYYNQDHLGNNREVIGMRGNAYQRMDYYPFGMPYAETGSPYNPDYQPYKYNGKELDRMHGLDTYDYGARQYNPIAARWDRMDPLCEKNPDVSPYHFCHNNPMNRVDADGEWDVTVHLAKDRSSNGYGVAVVSDRTGQEIFKFIVRAEGAKGHDRMKPGADTPLGTYDIPNKNAWTNGKSRAAYGPNDRLVMIPESGEIVESGRNDIRIHGGRQEIQNQDGTWQRKENAKLEKTMGCLRASDEDMKTFKTYTDYLESTDSQEVPGKVFVKDDIEQYNKNRDE